MGGNPSVPTDKSCKLQVIGAGAPRTGTLSMSLALERLLDEPVMHGGSQLVGREDAYVKLLYHMVRQRNNRSVLMKHLREITAGFVGITDAPGCSFIPELLELYPDAKVVLVTRDPERWVRSIGPVLHAFTPWWVDMLLWPCPGWRWLPGLVNESGKRESERLPSFARGGSVTTDMLEEHNEWVKKVTPPNQLLVMRLDEGWEPLCRFLDKPIPAEPFPRANDSAALAAVVKRVMVTCIAIWASILIAIGVLLCFFLLAHDVPRFKGYSH